METRVAHTVKDQTNSETSHDAIGPRTASAVRREASVEKIETQLDEWSNQLDELVVGCLEAGAHENDPYRMRIEALRVRHAAVREKFTAFTDPVHEGGTLAAFRSETAEDWSALEAGFENLTR